MVGAHGASTHRGWGIARRLLRAAGDGRRAQGWRMAEADPRVPSTSAATSAAAHHVGPLGLDLSAGCIIHHAGSDGSLFPRRALQHGPGWGACWGQALAAPQPSDAVVDAQADQVELPMRDTAAACGVLLVNGIPAMVVSSPRGHP